MKVFFFQPSLETFYDRNLERKIESERRINEENKLDCFVVIAPN